MDFILSNSEITLSFADVVLFNWLVLGLAISPHPGKEESHWIFVIVQIYNQWYDFIFFNVLFIFYDLDSRFVGKCVEVLKDVLFRIYRYLYWIFETRKLYMTAVPYYRNWLKTVQYCLESEILFEFFIKVVLIINYTCIILGLGRTNGVFRGLSLTKRSGIITAKATMYFF